MVDQVRDHLREREWKRALGGIVVLVRYYPQGILLLDERRMERHRLPRRLKARREELEAYERRLRELRDTEESGSVLAKEREEVLLLRRRVERLKRRMQELNRRGWFLHSGKTRGVLTRLGGVWAKALRK